MVNKVTFSRHPARRFWGKVQRGAPNECWPWIGYVRPNGYGRLTLFPGLSIYAHRAAYLLTFGALLDGMLICHDCDNRRCCNPNHLFAGTQLANMRDAQRKGRISRGAAHARSLGGERSSFAKLTMEQVIAIRNDPHTRSSDLAARFGVSADNVRRIRRGDTWRRDSDGNR